MNNNEIIIVNHKRSKVFYNKTEKYYRKLLLPKMSEKIKFILKLKRYPGNNFIYIKNELAKLSIKSTDYFNVSKYEIFMNEVEGISVEKAIETLDQTNKEYIAKKYITILKLLFENNIYAPDATLDNFIVHENEIIAIDFDTYKKNIFSFFKKKKMKLATIKFLNLKSDYLKNFNIDLVKMYLEAIENDRKI